MSNPYVGEIRMFGGNFAPAGWMFCEGQLLPISENETLFNLIGTTYGGDGQQTFALPDLRGRLPIHTGIPPGGPSYVLAQKGGTELVTLSANQVPSHVHALNASKAASSQGTAVGNVTGDTSAAGANVYGLLSAPAALDSGAVVGVGGSQPHDNRMPYLAVSFIISLFGIFPSQN
jgi:microcystin-dependent protein